MFNKNRHGDSSAGRGSAAPGGDSHTIWQVYDALVNPALRVRVLQQEEALERRDTDTRTDPIANASAPSRPPRTRTVQVRDLSALHARPACSASPQHPHPPTHPAQHLPARGLLMLSMSAHAVLQLRPPQGVIPPSGVSTSIEHPKNSRRTSKAGPLERITKAHPLERFRATNGHACNVKHRCQKYLSRPLAPTRAHSMPTRAHSMPIRTPSPPRGGRAREPSAPPARCGTHPAGGRHHVSACAIAPGPAGDGCGVGGGPQRPPGDAGPGWVEPKGP